MGFIRALKSQISEGRRKRKMSNNEEGRSSSKSTSMMNQYLMGLLKVRVMRGVNLAYRDTRGSDPYVVLRFGSQKVKTSVKKKNGNPEWNEDLTLSISETNLPVKVEVYDKDTFTRDDPMGDAELDIQPFIDAQKLAWDGISDGTLLKSVQPSRQNCLAAESKILYKNGKVVQDVILRLRNVESGEVELQLQWVNISSFSH